MKENERQKFLSKHKYKVFFDKKDGRWKTTLSDETKKNGRRLIAKRDLSVLENEIVMYYKNVERENQIDRQKIISKNITLKEIYPLWLQSRKLEVNSIGTVKKNDQDWKRYYLNDKIIDIPMVELTIQQLKDWAHSKIDENQLNKRDYYNMAIIIKQCFKYAVDSGFIENDTWSMVKINTKKLQKNIKKGNDEEIYFYEEQKQLIEYSLYMFNKNPRNITALAIPLIFVTGLRIGEIVSLKYSDIDEINNVIIINKSESVIYELDGNGKFSYSRKEVQDHTKTLAGIRKVPYISQAKELIRMIKEASEQYGFYDEGYIFCPNSQRVHANSIDKKLYNYCAATGVDKKSAHKIRKTFISRLIHSRQVDIDTVCRVAGHVDMKTTFMSYCYSLDKNDTICDKFERVLGVNEECKQV